VIPETEKTTLMKRLLETRLPDDVRFTPPCSSFYTSNCNVTNHM
jgi:hypothetical protein